MKKKLFILFFVILSNIVFASGELLIEKGTDLSSDINWYESEFALNNNVVVAQWKITNTTSRDVILDEIKLIGSGTGDESKINVTIYEDNILTGKKTYQDVLLGSNTFIQNNGSATIILNENESLIPAGEIKNYLIVYSSVIGEHSELDTFKHYISALKGRITSNNTEVTGAYEGMAQFSPTTSFITLKPFFVSLSSKTGLMHWVANGELSSAKDFNMIINGNYSNTDSFTLMRIHNCFPNISSSGYQIGGGGQYNIKNSSLVQKFMSSEENFSGFSVVLRSVLKKGTDEVTLTIRKNSIDGEIVAQKTLNTIAALINQKYYFEINSCENIVCGDGILDDTEECENNIFNGQDCTTINPEFYSGVLMCENCTITTKNCYGMEQTIQNSCIMNNAQNTTFDCTFLNSEFDKNYVSGELFFDNICAFDLDNCLEEIIVDENKPVIEEPIVEPDQNEPSNEKPFVEDPQVESFCGDGIIDLGEFCETNDLREATCESLGFDGGILGCNNNCNFDTSNCYILDEEEQVIPTASIDTNTRDTNQQVEIKENTNEIDFLLSTIIIIVIILIVITSIYFFKIKK